jgi:hypothetical protein
LESAAVVGGLSAVTAGLVSLGIPKDSAVKYEAEVADKFVMVVHGTAEELDRARAILAETSPVSIEKHEPAAKVNTGSGMRRCRTFIRGGQDGRLYS